MLLDGNDADFASVLAVVFEADLAVHLRKERVVLAEPDVEPGLEASALLAHENRSASDDVAVVTLHAEALRIAVAPVAGAALTFFMSHDVEAFRSTSTSNFQIPTSKEELPCLVVGSW